MGEVVHFDFTFSYSVLKSCFTRFPLMHLPCSGREECYLVAQKLFPGRAWMSLIDMLGSFLLPSGGQHCSDTAWLNTVLPVYPDCQGHVQWPTSGYPAVGVLHTNISSTTLHPRTGHDIGGTILEPSDSKPIWTTLSTPWQGLPGELLFSRWLAMRHREPSCWTGLQAWRLWEAGLQLTTAIGLNLETFVLGCFL